MCWCGHGLARTPWTTSRKCRLARSNGHPHRQARCLQAWPRDSDLTSPSGLGRRGRCPPGHTQYRSVPIPCSDDEKSRQMWRRYQEREDSRISGEQGHEEKRAGMGWEWVWELGVSPCFVPSPPDLFVGQLKSSLTCSECGYCSTAFDPFWDLSLPIPKVRCPCRPPAPCPTHPVPDPLCASTERLRGGDPHGLPTALHQRRCAGWG